MNATIADTPEKIEALNLLTLKQALKLETMGMKHSRFSAYKVVKQKFGFTGDKLSVYNQFVTHLKSVGILNL